MDRTRRLCSCVRVCVCVCVCVCAWGGGLWLAGAVSAGAQEALIGRHRSTCADSFWWGVPASHLAGDYGSTPTSVALFFYFEPARTPTHTLRPWRTPQENAAHKGYPLRFVSTASPEAISVYSFYGDTVQCIDAGVLLIATCLSLGGAVLTSQRCFAFNPSAN